MAGHMKAERERTTSADILFDLTPDDDKRLSESDLLDLINYGQVRKPIKVPGVNGRAYEMDLALLWDEDHIDILRRTSAYATDPLLRIRLMRRFKLFKAIQRIDNHDYSNSEDTVAKRELWAILLRMADSQVEYLDSKYVELELERNMQMIDALKIISEEFKDPDVKKHTSSQAGVDQHLAEFQKIDSKKETLAATISDVVEQAQGSEKIQTKEPVTSPKQNAN